MESEGVEGIEDIEDIEGVEHGYLFQENPCDRRSRMTLAKAFWTLVARLLGDRSEAFKKAFAIQDFPSTLVPLFADIHRHRGGETQENQDSGTDLPLHHGLPEQVRCSMWINATVGRHGGCSSKPVGGEQTERGRDESDGSCCAR